MALKFASIVCSLLLILQAIPAAAFDLGRTRADRGSLQAVALAGHPPLNLYVEEHGSGPPLVLLHGLGGSGYVWRLMVPELARTHRVITIDLKGFGRSDKPFDTAYGPIDQARLIAQVLRSRKLTNVTLVGHSFGGLVALITALVEPRRISKLVLLSTPALPQAPSPAVALMQQPVLPYVLLTIVPAEVQAAIGLFTEAIGMDHITQTDVTFYADPLRQAGGRHALIQTARQLMPHNASQIIASYSAIRQPTLVVACRGDRVVPMTTATYLARNIPAARLKVLEGCDHIPPEQAPAQVVEAIQRFR